MGVNTCQPATGGIFWIWETRLMLHTRVSSMTLTINNSLDTLLNLNTFDNDNFDNEYSFGNEV